jgi:hypothetical protein
VLFAPLAIGNHIDHCIVRNVARDLPAKHHYYWADHPYVAYSKSQKQLPIGPCIVQDPNPIKKQAFDCYKSQQAIINHWYSIESEPERFYRLQSL